ncbi:PREDICTED: polyubiquitin-A-like [Brassica oleracea var. oleracea]|uniref:polyubiquitin-A-like n=1 Tax=Brassica oleracea var. oleracea TaxID=109376 RepID=UPI0006A6D2E9|nr:PREDICTED: polyubiquitin-A-like [Brassica oleracea var. oleracea]
MQISIKTLKGKSINLEVEDSSNTIDVKIHGEPMSELVLRLRPSGRGEAAMRIFVATLSGRSHTLQVKGSDTIGEVKTKFFEIDGTPVDQLRIIFAGVISITTVEGKNINLEVEDSSKPIDLKINGPIRQLVLGLNPDAYPTQDAFMRIFVSTIKEKTFILQVKGSDTIKKVKTMIHDQGGLPVDQLNLNFLGSTLENRRTVAYYNIKPDSNLVIVQRGCIC